MVSDDYRSNDGAHIIDLGNFIGVQSPGVDNLFVALGVETQREEMM